MSRSGAGSVLDRPLGRPRGGDTQVSLSAFAYLYSELVQYHQSRVASISELERRLESSGYGVGFKVLELLAYRSRESKRETRIMSILQFISSSVWKSLFSKAADSLERSIDHADEFMIVDYEPITSTFLSVPSDLGQLSADAYISGIIAGVLEGAGFTARVTAHGVAVEEGEVSPVGSGGGGSGGGGKSAVGQALAGMGLGGRKEKTVFLIKFSTKVIERDTALER